MKLKKSEIKLLILEIFMILLFLANLIFLEADNYIIAMAIVVMFFISTFVLGYEEDRHRFKKDGILFAIIFGLAYEIFIYVSGIFIGFLKSGYSLSLFTLLMNVLPFAMIITTGEVLRYVFLTKGEKRTMFYVLTFILFVLIDTSANIFQYDITNSRVLVEVICLILLPSIAKNFLLTYWMKRFGIYANIIYLCITSLLVFIVPIIPDFNKYLQAVIALIYPIIIYFITRRVLRENVSADTQIKRNTNRIVSLAVIIFLLIIIALTSGIFKYYFLTIGSGSMEKELYIGDVVIVKKLNQSELKEIKEGTIIVFRMQNKVVVHRVTRISKEDGMFLFRTKGDNNEEEDNWVVTENNLIGLTEYKIPVIGLPSVWLYEFVEGSKVNE
jgi:signal peptidase I